MNTASNKTQGKLAEELAQKYLQQQGLRLLHKNFYSRFGEIDLIMQDQSDTVFIEVRFRKSNINDALISISNLKQKKLIRTAQYYLTKQQKDINCRFDIIAIDGEQHIKWLKNAIMLQA